LTDRIRRAARHDDKQRLCVVFGDRAKVYHPSAGARADGPDTIVGAVERLGAAAERSHHGGRDVVAAVHAARVSAREKEKRWCRVDDDATDVFRLGRASLLFDFEAEGPKVGGFGAQPRRVVFTLTSLCEPKRGRAVPTKVHDD
jgi:hypothetical protein